MTSVLHVISSSIGANEIAPLKNTTPRANEMAQYKNAQIGDHNEKKNRKGIRPNRAISHRENMVVSFFIPLK